jgi:creatinine amidohydrolase
MALTHRGKYAIWKSGVALVLVGYLSSERDGALAPALIDRWKEATDMEWESLTASDFAAAVKETKGVCLLPLPCIEKHGEHLPLGTDLFIGREVCLRAAEVEPAIVFPPFYLTQILGAKHQPGTIAAGRQLMLDTLEMVCDEIGRNGLRKIILFVSHGGNDYLAHLFIQTLMDERKDYMVYLAQGYWDPVFIELKEKILESEFSLHGGEMETSMMLAIRPELVMMSRIDPESGQRLGRLDHLQGIPSAHSTPVSWYADFPDHYAGDARPSTAEKGERFLRYLVQRLVEAIRSVKEDTTAQKLYDDFFGRTQHRGTQMGT